MSDDVEPVEGEVVPDAPPRAVVPYAPAAGEVIDLSDRPRVAATIRELTDWMAEVFQPLLSQLQAAMVEEADRQGAYTLRFGRLEVRVDGPDVGSTKWTDPEGLRAELLAAGLPRDRVEAVAPETRTVKVVTKEADRVAKSAQYRAIIERHRVREPRSRRAQVKRVGG